MQTVNGNPAAGARLQNAFTRTVHAEKDLKYWGGMPPFTEGLDHWFWDKLSIIEPPLKRDFTVGLGYLDKSSGSYSITLNLYGQTNTGQNPDHHTRVYVNNTSVDDFTWDGQTALTRTVTNISPDIFVDGDNVISLEAVADTGATVDSYYVNWLDVACRNRYRAEKDIIRFHNDGTGTLKFSITGFSSTGLWSFDVTDPFTVKRITTNTVYQSGSQYGIDFQDTLTENRTYYTIGENAFSSAASLSADEESVLSAPRDAVDYIIITHAGFSDRIQELKSYRQSKGLQVEVVKVQDIYDEFSFGVKDARAIKDFLTYAYQNWNRTGHPAYVLLVGDTTIDYRDDLGLYAQGQEDFVPTYLYQTQQLGDTPTDNWFACVNGSDYLPDMIIGRLCVKTDDDLRHTIDKIKKYEAEKSAAWCGNVIFAADNEPIFESLSDSLVGMLPEGFNAVKVYLSQYENVGAATEDLVARINSGAVITNYTGHGSTDNWSGEFLFHTEDSKDNIPRNDVDLLNNGEQLTFIISLNCLNGFFASPFDGYSLAEEFMRSENRGAAACLSPTGLGYPSEHQVLAKKIFTGFFEDENNIAGSLVTGSKIEAYTQINSRDIIETFTLFGDPAMQLKLVTGGDFTAFKTIAPGDNETLPPLPLPTFTWGRGLYERFKVQFSPQPAFAPESTITAPLFPLRFISADSYTPNIFIWAFVHILAAQNSTMYWRVAAYDENFNQIAATEPENFILQR
jgi:hypothetical protein